MLRRNTLAVKILFVLVVPLFICFSNYDIQAQTGVTKDEILVGFFGALSGGGADYGIAVKNGAKMYFDAVNSAGGIHGRQIKVIWEDSGCSPAGAIGAVKKLIHRDKVFCIFGGICSSATIATIPFINKAKIPIYVAMACTDSIFKPFNKYVFRSNVSEAYQPAVMTDFAMSRFKPKRVAVMYQPDDFGHNGRDGVIKTLKDYGLEPVAMEICKMRDTDFSSQVLSVKKAKAQAVLLFTYTKPTAIIVRQAYELGLDTQFISSLGGCSPMVIDIAGEKAIRGRYASITGIIDIIEGPRLAHFLEDYKKKYPEHSKRPGIPGMYDVEGYGSARLFVEGLWRAGRDLNHDNLIKGLESIHNFYTGALSRVTFSPTNHDGLDGANFWIVNSEGKREYIETYYSWVDKPK